MQLKIDNDYSYLVTDNTEIKHFLWSVLRRRERNYFHNPRFKARTWDGYIEFFKLETGKFLTGLLPEVRAALHHRNVSYTVQDLRSPLAWGTQSIDENFLNQFRPEVWPNGEKSEPMTLRDYQVDFVNGVIKHNRGVIFSPTSSGKTAIMVSILKCLPPNTPTLVLQNRVALAQQNYDEISNWGFPNVGSLWGGSTNPSIITVASVQSVDKIEKLLPKFRAVIVDEIHDMMSTVPKQVYRRLKNCGVRVALSATPFKFGSKDEVQKFHVKGFFGPVLKTKSTESGILTTKELQDRGILPPSHCTFYPITKPLIPHDIYIDAVTRGIAESYYFHDIVTRLAKLQTGRTLILVDRVAHGDALSSLLPGSLWVQGKDDEKTRKHVIGMLQKGKGNVVAIATQQIFNTGINVKVHSLINAAGGQAEHLIIQRMGRGLRTADDKEMLRYYDFLFLINDYLESHSRKRIKILKEEGHELVVKDDIDF